MAPLIQALKQDQRFESQLCVTGQHRDLLDQVLLTFDLEPDFDLDIMTPGQSLSQVTSKALLGLDPIICNANPDWVFVHGDTTSAAMAALAAYYQSKPVAHVEAGLRTYDISSPWPEEVNRRIISTMASLHFAPTEDAKANLLAERIPDENIVITGNTVIDALFMAQDKISSSDSLARSIAAKLPPLTPNKKLILVTGHRRESFGKGLENLCSALTELSRRDDVQIIYPVHPNPHVKANIEAQLQGCDNIDLIAPLNYLSFVSLMSKAYIIITDSGGIQEEAPSLHVPVLVTRDTTERPEALKSGTVELVGTNPSKIVSSATRLLDDKLHYKAVAACVNPYGDGKATGRIISRLLKGR